MEGLLDIYLNNPEKNKKYYEYVKEYLDNMMELLPNGDVDFIFERAGYVDYHGADCYKTASILVRLMKDNPKYQKLAEKLYSHLTDKNHINGKGNVVCVNNMEECLGFNYWHGWGKDVPPKYKVWLDGIYMLQPFIANYAKYCKDEEELERIQKRLDWVATEFLAPNGLYYHAINCRDDVCAFHWLRAIGWYGMAMVDVMEALPEKYLPQRKKALKILIDGMLPYQDKSGMWRNLVDMPLRSGNRLETSGTAMMVYTILKGVRLGWLDPSYKEFAIKGFLGIVENKLDENGLKDIYLKASANATNNYENTEYYLTDEGKGSGPFIMAYSEMLYLFI